MDHALDGVALESAAAGHVKEDVATPAGDRIRGSVWPSNPTSNAVERRLDIPCTSKMDEYPRSPSDFCERVPDSV
jgi:hypothetical protein